MSSHLSPLSLQESPLLSPTTPSPSDNSLKSLSSSSSEEGSTFASNTPAENPRNHLKMDTWYKDIYLSTLPKLSDRIAKNIEKPCPNMWSGDHPMGGADTYEEMKTRYPLSDPFDTLAVLQDVIQPEIEAPKSTLNRFAGPWTSQGKGVLHPEALSRIKIKPVLILDEDGDVTVKLHDAHPNLRVIEVLCSATCLHKSDNFDPFLAMQEMQNKPLVVNLINEPAGPVLFILQLLHCSDNGPFPHRPDKYEELLDIIDMAVKLGCLSYVLKWLKTFADPDYRSSLVGMQGSIITLDFACSYDPPATAEDFAGTSKEFIKRCSATSLTHFGQTYLGACFTDHVHASLHIEVDALVRTLTFRIEDLITNMTKTSGFYPDSRKSCAQCSALNPLRSLNCVRCKSTKFQPHFCSPQSRGGVFIEALFDVRLFPLTQSQTDSSATMMVRKALKLKDYHHECQTITGGPCYLRATLDTLHEQLKEIMDSVRGLCLECAWANRDSRLSKLSENCSSVVSMGGQKGHQINAFIDAHESRIFLSKRALVGLDEDGVGYL